MQNLAAAGKYAFDRDTSMAVSVSDKANLKLGYSQKIFPNLKFTGSASVRAVVAWAGLCCVYSWVGCVCVVWRPLTPFFLSVQSKIHGPGLLSLGSVPFSKLIAIP